MHTKIITYHNYNIIVYNIYYSHTCTARVIKSILHGEGMWRVPKSPGSIYYRCKGTFVTPAAQARSQGEFEGVRTKPPCSLAKLIFNETAVATGYNHSTVQWYCYRWHTSQHAAATRGSHIHVACRSVCDRDQEFWSVKIFHDRLSLRSEAIARSINCTTKAL